MTNKLEGGCYCKQVRYEAVGEPMSRLQCHCRECAYTTGGNAVAALMMPADGFKITKGETKKYTRDDIPDPITREFCGNCGTNLTSRLPNVPNMVLIKVGSLDDQQFYGKPDMVLYAGEKLSFHHIPEGVVVFDKRPGM
jgi:hypothetical protein